ncbi:MAG: peptidoglycan DD-metalloendopeptidase family protein [Thiolinea sp.]
MQRAIKQFILFLFIALCLHTQAAAFPKHNSVPGGIAILAIAPTSAKRPIVHYEGNRVTVVPHQKEWVSLVGIPLDATTGTHKISITHPVTQKRFDAPFQVTPKNYRLQRLTIRNKNKVNPNKKSTERIIRELAVQKRLKTQFSEREAQLDFMKPVKGRDSGRFGLRRIINGQKRNPHSGMDIAAPTGTPIRATTDGQVLYTGDFFFSGNVVYVDHGSGVISMYAHLSKTNVQPGQWISKGQIIGEVGSTGRVTGPHLHWSVYLNGQVIDPGLFTQKMN